MIDYQEDKKVGILGVGNILLSDEGFGPHFVKYLEKNYVYSDEIEIIDGGTAGIMLSSFVEAKESIFIIDVVNIDSEPGDIYLFNHEEITAKNIQSSLSAHQVGLSDIITLNSFANIKAPKKIEYITIVPKSLDAGVGLTSCLESKMEEILKILNEKLIKLDENFKITPIKDAHKI